MRRYRRTAIGLALTDVGFTLAALMTSYPVRYSMPPMPLAELAVVVTAPLLWVGVFRAFNLYAPLASRPARAVSPRHWRDQPQHRPGGDGELLVQVVVPAALGEILKAPLRLHPTCAMCARPSRRFR